MSSVPVATPSPAHTAPGHPTAVPVKDGGAAVGDLRGATFQEAHQIGVGAEAAETDANGVLDAGPGGGERVGHAVDDDRPHG